MWGNAMKMLSALIAAAAVTGAALPASATTLIADAGWQDDLLIEPNAPATFWATVNSAWDFTVLVPSVFRVTDAFATGDNLKLFSGATEVATQVFSAMPSFGSFTGYDTGWTSAAFSKIEYLVGPGTYSLTILGDGGGGLPAGFGVRLDSLDVSSGVPEPATWGLLIVGFGMLGAALRSRRGRFAAFAPT